MQQQTFTVADYLLTRLKELDVEHVFQIPGDYVKHFTQALEDFDGIQTIAGTNELDTAYAADAYARTRGLGAMSLQFGVSTFTALNTVAGAYVEHSPVVVISAAPGADARNITNMYDVLYHHSTGNLDLDRSVYANVTVRAITLDTNVGAPKQIDDLLIDALTYSRPVYIACYKEVWGQPCPRPRGGRLEPRHLPVAPGAVEDAVAQAWSMITAAEHPIIFAGVEPLRFGLSDLLQRIIDASGFVYTTTSLGKSVLTEGGDKFAGTYSDVAAIPSVQKVVEEADLVLTLGALITDDYVDFIESKYAKMVFADCSGARAGYFKYPDIPLQAFMEALLERFEASDDYPLDAVAPPQPTYPEPWVSNSDPFYDDKPHVLTYNRFFQHSMQFLHDQDLLDRIVMTFGVSSAMYVATNAYGLEQGSFVASAAWQDVGFDLGTAVGAQLGSGKRAWTIAGDGGLLMVCQALSTLARYKLNGVVWVMSNGVYAIEQVFVDLSAFDKKPPGQFDTFDILPDWDYLALAKAYGAQGIRVETVEELQDALKYVQTVEDQPVLVQVVLPERTLPRQMLRLGEE